MVAASENSVGSSVGSCRGDEFDAVSARVAERARLLCARYAIEAGDVDDATQETLVRWLRHRGGIRGNVDRWLRKVARSVCVDIARARVRERRRRLASAMIATTPEDRAMRLAHIDALGVSLGGVDGGTRRLLERRFVDGAELGVLAAESQVSVSTMSRRVQQAIEEVIGKAEEAGGVVVREVGDRSWDARMLARDLGKIRVGVLVGLESMRTPTDEGWYIGIEGQVRSLPLVADDRLEMVALVEPRTGGVGAIERTVRDFGLAAGVVDVTDARAMFESLDVIWVGNMIAMLPRALGAIERAVEMGVGLYNESWMGTTIPGLRDRRVLRLMLAEAAATHHTEGGHGLPRPAAVRREHPVIPGFERGRALMVEGCGPIQRMARGSEVIIERSDRPMPTHHSELLPWGGVMPVLASGRVGEGRVLVLNQFLPETIGHHRAYEGHWFSNVFGWLARRRELCRMVSTRA